MKTLNYIIPIFLLVLANSCAKTDLEYNTELKFDTFSNITIKNASNVTIQYGEEQSVLAYGQESDIKNIISEVKSNTLVIDVSSTENNELEYIITLPIIREVKNEANTKIIIDDFDQEGSLNIVSSNNGNIELGEFENLSSLNIDLEGTSIVTGNEPFENLIDISVVLKDSAFYVAYPIEAKNAILALRGTGSCYLSVKETLTAVISGTGVLYYKGNPKLFSNSSGDSQIIQVQ